MMAWRREPGKVPIFLKAFCGFERTAADRNVRSIKV
jgi:hypothetical protein